MTANSQVAAAMPLPQGPQPMLNLELIDTLKWFQALDADEKC
jgi:hypothetical protein